MIIIIPPLVAILSHIVYVNVAYYHSASIFFHDLYVLSTCIETE